MTVRFDRDEALKIDRWILGLRTQTGVRWGKAEVSRGLLRMARTPYGILRDTLTTRAKRAGA